jgi:hypothetical protein
MYIQLVLQTAVPERGILRATMLWSRYVQHLIYCSPSNSVYSFSMKSLITRNHRRARLLKQQSSITVYNLSNQGKQTSIFHFQQTNRS